MRPPRAEFSALAATGRLRWWTPIVTFAAAIAAMLAASIPLVVVAHGSEPVRQRGIDVAGFTPEVAGVSPWAFLLWILLPFGVALAVLTAAVRTAEGRSWRTLVSAARPGPRWRRTWAAGGVWFALAVAADLLGASFAGAEYVYRGWEGGLLPVAIVALLLVPAQVAFEELSMRGYLHQVVSYYTGRPLWGIAVSSLVFAALHFGNPEVARYGWGAMAGYYVGFAVFLAAVSVLDGGLELALGIHLATNLYAILCVGVEGSALPMPALWSLSSPSASQLLLSSLAKAASFTVLFACASGWRVATLARRVPPRAS